VETVGKGATQTTLIAAPASVTPGSTVTLKVTVAALAPAAGSPSGIVTFKEGTRVLGTATLSARKATFTTSSLAIGSHSLSAIYRGDAAFVTSASAAVTVTVDPKVGPEFRVNSYTTDAQQRPAVAPLAAGAGFVVLWQSNGQDGSGFGIYGQRYLLNGHVSGSEFRLNTELAGDQTAPAVAGLGGGGFVAVWQSAGQDGSGAGIYGQRFAVNGRAAGAEFRVNTATANDQGLPSVAALSDGGFVAVWQSNLQDGSGLGIYGQRFAPNGKRVGVEFPVNTTTTGAQSMPRVAALGGGGFAVTWQSAAQDGSGLGVYGRHFDATGAPVGSEFLVNTQTVNDQASPAIAGLSDGSFAATWMSKGQDHSGLGIYGQRYDGQGSPVGQEFRINTTTKNNQLQPSIAAFSDGGFAVAWTSLDQDGSGYGVYVQCYDAQGLPVDGEFRANTTTLADQSQPAVAAFAGGKFVVTWTSNGQDGSLDGVYGQLFQVDNIASSPTAVSASRRTTR
jgi:hypothetical protein